MAHKRPMPTELLERILKHADVETLKACSLVNKTCSIVASPFIEEKAWVSHPVKNRMPWDLPMRQYKKIKLEGPIEEDMVWGFLYYFDPAADKINALELSKTNISENTLMDVLTKWRTIYQLVVRDDRIVMRSPYESGETPYNRTITDLTLIEVSTLRPVFRGIQKLTINDSKRENWLRNITLIHENTLLDLKYNL